MENEKRGTGANPSAVDIRTVKHMAEAAVPLVTGGIDYLPSDIEDQHQVGICTAISRVQLRQKQTGKKYSPDFQYLLQKKYYDLNWQEGSSILNACKVAKTYGFLPLELFTWVTESDRFLPYSVYIAKLQAIPLEEILRLLKLCVDPIAGYASVNVSDPQAIARAIMASPGQTGILCRYGCQKNWWTPSWLPRDINPLRWAPETSGHAIINSKFNYAVASMQKLANTWSPRWCLQGSADINWDNYKMNEAWVDLPTAPVIIEKPTLRLGMKGVAVSDLQAALNAKNGSQLVVDGDFGQKTLAQVLIFQKANGLTADGVVGALTWGKLLQPSPSSGGGTSIKSSTKNLMSNFFSLFQSSSGSGNLSTMWRGIFLLLIPLAISYANRHGYTITQDQVMYAVAQVTTIVGQALIVIGLARKFYVWIKGVFVKPPQG